jgi:membrane protein
VPQFRNISTKRSTAGLLQGFLGAHAIRSMGMNLKEAFSILKQTFYEWMDDQAPTLGAALAYYTVFSLAMISISIAGLAFGGEAAEGQVFDQLRGLLGDASGWAMQNIVQDASAEPKTGLVATVIGFVMLLFGASGVFGQLQVSLNTTWGVQPKPAGESSTFSGTAFFRLDLFWWWDFCSSSPSC